MRLEIHQLEGQDTRRRVFNRHVDIERAHNSYTAAFYYEGTFYSSDPQRTIKESLSQLIRNLQQKGYCKLCTRLNFRGRRYFAEQEPWIHYEDVAQNGREADTSKS